MKDLIVYNLESMHKKSKYNKEPWKAKAYMDAVRLFQRIEGDIHTEEDIKELKLGKSIKEKVLYMIENKTNLPQIQGDEDSSTPLFETIDELAKIHNIGIVKAKELAEVHGIRSFEELKQNMHLLNDKQKQGVMYHHDILQRIPRSEMVKHDQFIETIMRTHYPEISMFSLVGSYRRNQSESGDIDLIICSKGSFTLESLIHTMTKNKYIKDDGIFALGKKKFMGMCSLPDGCTSRRIDILLCPPLEYPFALLYFTGSKEYNIKMREQAQRMGYRLNEKGVWDNSLQKVKNLKTEEDIFKFLSIKFVEPSDRIVENYQEL